MATRGAVYWAYGQHIHGRPVEHWLERSTASLRAHHPDLPVHVLRSDARPGENDEQRYRLLGEKANLLERSPYDETLFLDLDTVVLDDLSFGFAQAQRHGLACAICESPWARRHVALRGAGDIVEYNTGVLFFTRQAAPVFKRWQELAHAEDWALYFVDGRGQAIRQPYNDQGPFAKALYDVGFNPFVLPLNWNFRAPFTSEFFGTLKIWHSYEEVPPVVHQLNAYYREPDSVIQMHRRG